MKRTLLATAAVVTLFAAGGVASAVAQGASEQPKAGHSEMNRGASGGAAQHSETNRGTGMKGSSATTGSGSSEMGRSAQGQETKGSAGASGSAEHNMKSGSETRGSATEHNGRAQNSQHMKNRSETSGSGANAEQKTGSRTEQQGKVEKNENRSGSTSKSSTTGAGSNAQESGRASTREQQGTRANEERTGSGSRSTMENQGRSETNVRNETNQRVSLNTEQKTKIRTTVLESHNAPKISRNDIHFSLNVGTVVPRTVHIATVPQTLVEIHPAWRGFEYFVVGDQIVIVDPRTMRIVEVLVV